MQSAERGIVNLVQESYGGAMVPLLPAEPTARAGREGMALRASSAAVRSKAHGQITGSGNVWTT